LDDEELASALFAAVRGDSGAFAVLWSALQPAVLRYLRVIVGEAAEDVASETWLQAARDLRKFTGPPPAFRVWLFTIARNRAIDERRRARRRPEEPRELWDRDAAAIQPDVANDVIQKSDTDWALSMIATLPKDQGEAVMLRVVAGLDVAQTAQVLGKRPGAVRVAAMRGLRRLAGHAEVQARRRAAGPPLGLNSPRPEGV
jgi:RNA polymerase sigma-70 factor (ECF subfamily)